MSNALSRRKLLKAGSAALAGAALVSAPVAAHAGAGDTPKNEGLVRKWYALWVESREWAPRRLWDYASSARLRWLSACLGY